MNDMVGMVGMVGMVSMAGMVGMVGIMKATLLFASSYRIARHRAMAWRPAYDNDVPL